MFSFIRKAMRFLRFETGISTIQTVALTLAVVAGLATATLVIQNAAPAITSVFSGGLRNQTDCFMGNCNQPAGFQGSPGTGSQPNPGTGQQGNQLGQVLPSGYSIDQNGNLRDPSGNLVPLPSAGSSSKKGSFDFDWTQLGGIADSFMRGSWTQSGASVVGAALDFGSNFAPDWFKQDLQDAAKLTDVVVKTADAIDKVGRWANIQSNSNAFSALRWGKVTEWTKSFTNVFAKYPWLAKVGGAFAIAGGIITTASGVSEISKREYLNGATDIAVGLTTVGVGAAVVLGVTLAAPVAAAAAAVIVVGTAVRYRKEIGRFIGNAAASAKEVASEAWNGAKSAFGSLTHVFGF